MPVMLAANVINHVTIIIDVTKPLVAVNVFLPKKASVEASICFYK